MAAASDLPLRKFMDDPNIVWRDGKKPDYTKADQLYLKGRTKIHAADSIEKTASDFAKTFEMELRHKTQLEDIQTITPDFKMSINGRQYMNMAEMAQLGPYNVFLCDTPLYDNEQETPESAEKLFTECFTEGFGWEVLQVIHGPPNLVYTWRHWTRMTGPFRDNKPTGEQLELFGCTLSTMTTDNKLSSVSHYFDPSNMLTKLQKQCPIHAKTEN